MRNEMLHRWEERWEHLQLILEVYQFARDAAVAEAWLIAQDPYLKSEELGVSTFLFDILTLQLLQWCVPMQRDLEEQLSLANCLPDLPRSL
jgi:hypothetical protein